MAYPVRHRRAAERRGSQTAPPANDNRPGRSRKPRPRPLGRSTIPSTGGASPADPSRLLGTILRRSPAGQAMQAVRMTANVAQLLLSEKWAINKHMYAPIGSGWIQCCYNPAFLPMTHVFPSSFTSCSGCIGLQSFPGQSANTYDRFHDGTSTNFPEPMKVNGSRRKIFYVSEASLANRYNVISNWIRPATSPNPAPAPRPLIAPNVAPALYPMPIRIHGQPAKQPAVAREPEISWSPGIGQRVRPSAYRHTRPPAGTRERKGVLGIGLAKAVKAYDMATEYDDAVSAVWKALPPHLRSKNASLMDKQRDIWENWEDLDLNLALRNLLWNHLEDKAIGKWQRAGSKAGRKIRPDGPSASFGIAI